MSRRLRRALVVVTACCSLALAPLGAVTGSNANAAQSDTLFSGRATAVKGTIAGLDLSPLLPCQPGAGANFCIADTGPVAAGGGELEESLLCYPSGNGCVLTSPVGDPTNGAVKARVLHAAVVAHGNASNAEASAANVGLNVAGVSVGAELLRAEAHAKCTNGTASVTGRAEVVRLSVNGYEVTVAESANFDVVAALPPAIAVLLPAGTRIVVNEQPSSNSGGGSSGQFDVNALHVVVPGVADVVVGAAHADIACAQLPQCPGRHLFVTGGGFFDNTVAGVPKAHFAVAGRNAEAWGHVLYKPTGLHVKKPTATVYRSSTELSTALAGSPFTLDTSTLGANFEGAAILYWTADGKAGEALAIDMGEPGRSDYFEIAGADSAGRLVSLGGGTLAGGNIQMHGKC